eukprot:XP_011660649.1 PREDICTED: cation-independent mannose-6-phosphate receptor [Strongylocentrotus purpuratus]
MAKKHSPINLSKLLLIQSFILLIFNGRNSSACTVGSFDLTNIQTWGTWTAQTTVDGTASTFYLNLCENVASSPGSTGCDTTVSSCLKQGDAFTNVGNHNDTLQLTINENTGGFRLDYRGSVCNVTEKYQTTIDFKCGTTLGSPNFLENSGCTYFFEWYSTVACSSVNGPALNEVPCSIYDSKGKERDLSPLIKLKGGYLVESPDADDLYINVCRDITADTSGPTAGCPAGSAGCLVKKGLSVGMGTPHLKLESLSDDELKLHYGGAGVLDSCNGFVPSVTVVFMCPREQGRFAATRGPIQLSSTNCQYQIQWQTEYACEVDMLSTDTCAFNSSTHGIDFDLSPLTKPDGEFYLIESDPDYYFYINICADMTAFANCEGMAVCQVARLNTVVGTSAGRNSNHELRYSDGELSLIYKGGDVCNHNKFQRTSVISFQCNKTKDLGQPEFVTETECTYFFQWQTKYAYLGQPEFVTETECTYFFQWQTKYACMADAPSPTSCRLANGKQRYDLSSLARKTGSNWLVLDGRHSHSETTESEYFINVCSEVVQGDVASEGCPQGSSACVVDTVGTTKTGKSLGKYLTSPVWQNNLITMSYTEGDVCKGTTKKRTDITFLCSPGDLESAPILVRKSDDGCQYDMEWHTAAACPLASKWGTDCRVFDDDAGVSFDLSPLKKADGHYKVSVGEYDYYINVCSDIKLSPCNDASHTLPHPAACQARKDASGVSYVLGQTNTSLGYFDGIIKLTYLNGKPYNSNGGTVTARMTEIAFLCDPEAGVGTPQFFQENNATYFFRWNTKYACPQPPIECVVTDEANSEQYDLSSLSKALEEENWSFVDERDVANRKKYYINVCRPINPHADCGAFAGVCQTGFTTSDRPSFAGVGTPQFFQENNATYFFRWNTKYACPQPPIECVVTDEANSEQYDLSSLSKALEEENWSFVDERDAANRKKYYINVCRPINPHAECGAFAGVCQTGFTTSDQQTSETALIPNLGVPKSPPTIESSGHLLLTYQNGSDCGESKQITSHIHFACNKGTLASTPRLLEVVDSCTYSFLWETEAACPIGVSTGENCTVRDSNSDYVFNLQPLIKQEGYQVFGPTNEVFKLNVCGAVPVQSCPAGSGSCLSPTLSLGSASSTLIFSDEGLLTLEYTGGTFNPQTAQYPSTVISFLCRRNASQTSPSPVFVRQEGSRYIFNFETPLACLPESVDCLISDSNGNQYDLSPLAKDSGNWEAVDTRQNYNGLSYHINVCRPINKGDPATSSCPGGPIGACQISESDNSAYNLGYVQAMPEAATDGALSLRYVNGDICHAKFHRSTRINFECSDTPGSPVFQTESAECEYLFSWETPAACPLKRVTGQGNCTVRVPEFGFQFNLSSLYNKTHDYTVTSTEHEYTINVCGPLSTTMGECASSDGVAACQKLQDGTFKNAGVFNKNLTYANGVLKLNYTTGSVCHTVYKRSTAINFYCDENVIGKGEPHYIQETSDCTYIFEWATPLACPPFKVVECSYRDGTSQYDLAPLSKMTDNYRVNAAGNNLDGDAYFINVCRSLWHRQGAQGEFCPNNAAACLQTVDSTGKKSYISLGEVGQGPTMENGHLVLRYESGATCPDKTGRKRTTVINIQCDKNSVGTAPMLDHVDGDCQYHFLWLSNYACDITEDIVKPKGDCTAMNPISGFRFDFNSLKKQAGYTVMGSDSHKYVINVCDALASSVCDGSNIGSCQEELVVQGNHFNAGVFNKNLFFDDSILFLRYDFGHACHNNHFNRSSVINFVCPHGSPVFQTESAECEYLFSWETPAACPLKIQCSVVNGSDTISLAPLINDQGYHLATTLLGDGSLTYINLCRPLNPIPGLTCHPNSAACQVKGGDPVNLGRVSEGPKIGADGRLSITYTQGDHCSSDGTKNVSSVIKFFCKQGVTQGTPTLEFIEDCIYQFTWGTNVVCPATAPESDHDCTFFNTALQYRFDFTALSKENQAVVASSAKTMKLKLCGLSSDQSGECKGAAICLQAGQDKYSLGQLSTQTISQEEEIFKVEYTGGSTCPSSEGKKRQTTIILSCDPKPSKTSPTFFSVSCPISLCKFVVASSAKTMKLKLCGLSSDQSGECKGAAICLQAGQDKYSLGQLSTQTISQEEEIFKVEYTGGSTCPSSEGKKRQTTIILSCDPKPSKTSPTFFSSDENCHYSFHWATAAACPADTRPCDLAYQGNVYDLSPLSQITGSFQFQDSSKNMYYMNLCQPAYGTPEDCPPEASMCRQRPDGQVDVLGMVRTQQLTAKGDVPDIEVTFFEGSQVDDCGSPDQPDSPSIPASSSITFKCANKMGNPLFQRTELIDNKCQFQFLWESKVACKEQRLRDRSSSMGVS